MTTTPAAIEPEPPVPEPVPEPRLVPPPIEIPPIVPPDVAVPPESVEGEPRFGGRVRLHLAGDAEAQAAERAATSRPVFAAADVGERTGPADPGDCLELRIDPHLRDENGVAVPASAVVAAWEAALREPTSETRWLLGAVEGVDRFLAGRADRVSGLTPLDRAVRFCFERSDRDFRLKLTHAALRYRDEGTGPATGWFRPAGDGALRAVRIAGLPRVDRVELVRDPTDPALLFRLGEIHLAVAYGLQAAELAAGASDALRVERLPSWDVTWFLWLEPERRWLNDPAFRRWLSGVIDRDRMLDLLFHGAGERAFRLAPGGPNAPLYVPQPDRPLAPMSRPRLSLAHPVGNPLAASIASRVRAVLALHDVDVEVRPLSRVALHDAARDGRFDLLLLPHAPHGRDPLLELEASLARVGPAGDEARERIHVRSGIAGATERREAAWSVERPLLEDVRIVPLVTLHAWIARHRQLSGLRPGPDGELGLEEVWWAP